MPVPLTEPPAQMIAISLPICAACCWFCCPRHIFWCWGIIIIYVQSHASDLLDSFLTIQTQGLNVLFPSLNLLILFIRAFFLGWG
eukprot:3019238-Ditylum_brightwellii.AAC.1